MRNIETIVFEPQCLADGAGLYDDVLPAIAELKSMGLTLLLAGPLNDLLPAFNSSTLDPDHTIYLTDRAEGIAEAKRLCLRPILMMNDPDEARRLAALEPAGGIVSLHELADFVRLVAAQNR